MALPQEFLDLAQRVNNWGRWGPNDEIGTLNLIDDQARLRGAACVRSGRAFSLALPLSEQEGIQFGAIAGRVNPVRAMVAVNHALTGDPDGFCSSDDVVFMGLQAATHWDGLAHVSWAGRIYNGHGSGSVTAAGAAKCGIGLVKTVVSRGVLLDVARAMGTNRLDGGYAITEADLEAAVEMAGARPLPGDIVLVRTGQMELIDRWNKIAYAAPSPGLSTHTVEWFRRHDVAAVGVDTMVGEVYPYQDDKVALPVHLLHLVEMGMTQGQNFVLNALAEDCAADGIYEFLLEASPEPFTNAVGSPVNPVAIK